MIQYPPVPKDKELPFFPPIATRGVPSVDEDATVDESFVSMHSEGGGGEAGGSTALGGSTAQSSDTMSRPARLDFGVLNLWVDAAGKKSATFDDGPSFDFGGHGIEAGASAGDFVSFVPGVDDKAIKIQFRVHGKAHIKSAKLELFARGCDKAVWSHHWGDAWGEKKEDISAFPGTAETGGITALGEFDWATIKPDSAIKAKRPDGTEFTAFPKGVLTLACSPYQLRLTVSGCTAKDTPPKGDQYAYPMTAWTFLHVAVKGFKWSVGKKEWLDDKRDDVDPDHVKRVRGDRGKGEYGFEGSILEELAKVNRFREGMVTPVVLSNNLTEVNDEFDMHKRLWGDGPRVPLCVTPILLDVGGKEVDAPPPDVVAGAQVMFDWTDEHPDRWKDTIDSAIEFQTKKTREYLESLHKKFSAKYAPRGSCNCPIDYGGKYGDDGAPVFPEQDGRGAFPAEVKPLATRSWAALGVVGADGTAKVLFHPSRMAGDRYDVAAYLYDPELDTTDKLDVSQAPGLKGGAGTFEVLHKRVIHHFKMGDIAGIDVGAKFNEAVARLRKQVSVQLEFRPISFTPVDYCEFMKKAAARLPSEGSLTKPLLTDLLWDPATYPGTAAFKVRSTTEMKAKFREAFQRGNLARVKFTPPPKLDGQHWVGQTSQATSQWFESITNGVGEREYWALTAADKAFQNGETLKGKINPGESFTIKTVGTAKCCWDIAFRVTQDASLKESIKVAFPDGTEHTIAYTKKTVSRRLRKNMTEDARTRLHDAWKRAVAKWNKPGGTFLFHLKARNDSDNSAGRIERLQAVLRGFVEAQDALVEKLGIWEKASAALKEFILESGTAPWRSLARKGLITSMFKPLAQQLEADHHDLSEGVLFFHYQRMSNLTDLPEAANWYKPGTNISNADKNNPRYYDLPVGAKDGTLWQQDPFRKVFYAQWPNPTDDKSEKEGNAKDVLSVMLHEMAHAVGIPHSPYPTVELGKDMPTASGPEADKHLAGEGCMMDYHPGTKEFCAICRLRQRGWKWNDLPGRTNEVNVSIEVKVDDVSVLFSEPATTPKGQMQRLQALGLYTRPLDFPIQAEREAAFAVSVAHAKRLFGTTNLEDVLDDAVARFIVEGGAIPKKNAYAKIRLPNNWGGYYGIADKMLDLPNHKDGDPPNFMDFYSLGADRMRLEREVLAANPALGAIPLRIEVTEVAGKSSPGAMAGALVWIEAIAPGILRAPTIGQTRKPVAGGFSYVDGYGAPPTNAAAKKFVDDKVANHAKDETPQKANVHFAFNGRRAVGGTDKNLSKTGTTGARNLFSSPLPGFPDLPPTGFAPPPLPPEGGDKPKEDDRDEQRILRESVRQVAPPKSRPNAVCVVADDNGVARVLFWPSLVAGDAYRFRISVEKPLEQGTPVAEVETGTMVRWRTVRLSHYYWAESPKDSSGLPDWVLAVRKAKGDSDTALAGYADLTPPIDLKGKMTEELARSFNELVFDPGADTPKHIEQADWTRMFDEWDKLCAEYPDVMNTPAGKNSSIYFFDLTPDEERKVYTAQLPHATPAMGWVQIRPKSGGPEDAIAHDWSAPDQPPLAPSANLVAIETGALISGQKDKKKKGAKVPLTGTVNYKTGAVRVVFETARATTDAFKVCYYPANLIDLRALFPRANAMPTTTPFIFPMVSPAEYNEAIGPGTIPMDIAGPADSPKQYAFISLGGLGLGAMLFVCMARALGGNGRAYLPGLILVQSSYNDPYNFLWNVTGEGKGYTNVVYVHSPNKDADRNVFQKRLQSLTLHELGHTLLLQHAPGNGGQKGTSADTHDPAEKDCVMTYSNMAERQHCGGCVATMRGMKVWESPITGNKKHPWADVPIPSPSSALDSTEDEQVGDGAVIEGEKVGGDDVIN